MDAPNAVWTTDFKGQFRTGDDANCFPLTVADGYSRMLLVWSRSMMANGISTLVRSVWDAFTSGPTSSMTFTIFDDAITNECYLCP
jgi:hypothetical protein